MDENVSKKRFGRRRLLDLIAALRPLGLNATLDEFAIALAPLCNGQACFRIESRMVANIIHQSRHQQLINSVIMAGCKRSGYETTYRDLYPVYVKACKIHHFEPVSLKTFQNRALQRESRYERTLKRAIS